MNKERSTRDYQRTVELLQICEKTLRLYEREIVAKRSQIVATQRYHDEMIKQLDSMLEIIRNCNQMYYGDEKV